MSSPRFPIERLGRHHARATFACGEPSLDDFIRWQARQDDERHATKAFVLRDPATDRLAGYYSLSASAVLLESLPDDARRRLPRYPSVPVVLLGRLAVDRAHRGRGFGEALLFDALRRALAVGTEQIGAVAVVVDALHDRARSFYGRYEFRRFPDQDRRLFLPMATIGALLAEDDA